MSESRVALVTGGGSGIGRACAISLATDGYEVVVVGRTKETLEETAVTSGRLHTYIADVSQEQEVDGVFEFVVAKFGRLDVLFNNAGTGAPPVPLEEISLEQWNRVVGVNLTGSFLCTQRAMKIMKSQSPMGGRIINNGSISAHVPRPHSAPYTATKHAITGLTRSTNLDGRDYQIACGQIDIGNALTDMTARMGQGMPQPDGSVRPEPTMDVQAVVDAVCYMASLPLDANVPFMTVMATEMPFIGRG